ncbi:hypothetical protein EST38_g1626 [Candolleomyces aberdarensis]|uniref:sn-1-specific diacylglycerol lipase n=1 Tax=Candolleomyces aberdarensis TaxID=2316362 RepID=A0A4Q2DYY6_9AGAR|nr:hypothetical protein EST38_g1626 [Candolleomyces aberdarensis]
MPQYHMDAGEDDEHSSWHWHTTSTNSHLHNKWMARYWDSYTRHGLDIALAVSSVGFHAAKSGTKFGFSVARGIATSAASVTSFAVDHAVFGGSAVARPVLQGAVTKVLTFAEQVALAPIHLGEYITTTSVLVAHSSINVLSVILPGSSEASFSLASFIDLVRREWSQHERDPQRPAKHYGITKVAWAIVGWVSLQGVTREWREKRWLRHLREVDLKDMPKPTKPSLPRKQSRIRVTSDVIFSGEGGAQIITANIGEETSESERVYLRRTRSKASMRSSVFSLSSFAPTMEDSEVEDLLPIPELKANLRRYSKLVLAGYGGASLLFFGVSPMQRYPSQQESSTQDEKTSEEAKLATAIDESEAEAAGESTVQNTVEGDIFQQYSWWDILLGKHDQEIFENTLAAHPSEPSKKSKVTALSIKSRAVIGTQHLMPRFWVLTDYHRQEVVLVIRGTMSLNEIAADLTCEPDWFEPAKTPAPTEDEHRVPGQFRFPSRPAERAPGTRYHVHGGMLKLAKAMGDIGKPVQLAVMEALHFNPDFDLVLCGHSLGAGVAALLGMVSLLAFFYTF